MSAPNTAYAGPKRPGSALWRSRTRRDQLLFLSLSLLCLVLAGVLHKIMETTRGDKGMKLVQSTPEFEKSYRSAAITFPRLTLGGFRGILSAALWSQAEEDKNNHKWVDLETKYDIIGALQPYFVSVYIYHSWNQAYNLSAQFQEEDTKYKWILDGLAYLYKGEQYNPGVSQLYYEEGNIYFMKLGGAFEREFFRAHWRNDLSRLHDLNSIPQTDVNKQNTSTQALALVRSFVSDDQRSYFHVTELPDPANTEKGVGWGIQISDPHPSEPNLPNLFKYRKGKDNKSETDPVDFRWGVSTFYFAYVEMARAMAHSPPESVGVQVADSRPAMALRLWCRDDCYYIYSRMKDLFVKLSADQLKKQADTLNRASSEVVDCNRNCAMIGPVAVDLFNAHLGRFPMNKNIHLKHIAETKAVVDAAAAEAAMFDALTQWHLADRKMTPALRQQFMKADDLYQKARVSSIAWVDVMYPAVEGEPVNPDRFESLRYADALKTRSAGIERLLTKPDDQPADLSFLEDEVVEK